jgi:hypothetical protein
MHKAVEYFNQIAELVGKGYPADWQQVARQMALICAQTPQPQPQMPEPAPTPEPLPEPPV